MKINNTQEQATLSVAAQKNLFLDLCARPHIEACGVLLGNIDDSGNWYIERTLPLRNVFSSPVYFEFAPEELLEVELAYPDQIVGVYHSHPTGFASASKTDRDNMKRVNKEQHIPWLWLIVRGPFDIAFTSRADMTIPEQSIIAYHHYQHRGLQHIPLRYEQTTSDASIKRLAINEQIGYNSLDTRADPDRTE
jgi:[CysO sulfur-carrier protein]-S-L-cysteine hydrolase